MEISGCVGGLDYIQSDKGGRGLKNVNENGQLFHGNCIFSFFPFIPIISFADLDSQTLLYKHKNKAKILKNCTKYQHNIL